MTKRPIPRRGWVAMKTRNIGLAVILLIATSVGLEVAVHGVESLWLDAQSLFFRTLFSPFALAAVIVAVIVVSAVSGAVGLWLADYKLRSPLEGFLLGLLLGPLGILIEAALPDLREDPQPGLRAKREH
jgi:hypothetical protein